MLQTFSEWQTSADPRACCAIAYVYFAVSFSVRFNFVTASWVSVGRFLEWLEVAGMFFFSLPEFQPPLAVTTSNQQTTHQFTSSWFHAHSAYIWPCPSVMEDGDNVTKCDQSASSRAYRSVNGQELRKCIYIFCSTALW